MNLQEYAQSVAENPSFGGASFGLNSPCQEMKAVETLNGVDSRVLFLQTYQYFDGQKNGAFNLIGEFGVLPLAFCLGVIRDFRGEFGHQESKDCRDERIKDGFRWRDGWYPFAFDQCDNRFLVMDFDPALQGTAGQIFLYDGRQTLGDWLAHDLPTLLDEYHAKLVESKFVEDDLYSGRFAAKIDETDYDC